MEPGSRVKHGSNCPARKCLSSFAVFLFGPLAVAWMGRHEKTVMVKERTWPAVIGRCMYRD